MAFDFFAATLFGLLGAAVFQIWRRARSIWQLPLALLWYALVAASHPLFVERLIGGYPGDSFHTLGVTQAAGLVALSAVMLAGLLLIAKVQPWARRLIIRARRRIPVFNRLYMRGIKLVTRRRRPAASVPSGAGDGGLSAPAPSPLLGQAVAQREGAV